MENRALIKQLWEQLAPDLTEQGYELVELEYARGGRTPVLRFYVDKVGGGVSLDDCAKVSQLLSALLDKLDFIGGRYVLEVSSPGVDRPLRQAADFRRFAGEPVRLQSLAPVEGRSRFRGTLEGIEDGLILVDCDGKRCAVHIENLKSARLDR
ncbi:MAG TPA: ribosome maturation factor RimP [Candidatus Hydrogenedentes bacterium]|nr:ribosome maturation factor RimP [Candidatus Hydrogenedentota bacterium]